ncbi:ribosomal protein S18-alanine N-acetyltransferase [Kaarinaea lacus]
MTQRKNSKSLKAYRSSTYSPQVSFLIRPMHEPDLDSIVRLEKQCYSHPWPTWLFRGALRTGMSCWILEAEKEIVGFGIIQIKNNWGHLMNICIAPRYRGVGLGKKMTLHLLSEARQRHAAISWLEVRPTNSVAIKLYKSLGFRKTKMRKNYYPSRRGRLPAIVMARKL